MILNSNRRSNIQFQMNQISKLKQKPKKYSFFNDFLFIHLKKAKKIHFLNKERFCGITIVYREPRCN